MVYEYLRPTETPYSVTNNLKYSSMHRDESRSAISSEIRIKVEPPDNPKDPINIINEATHKNSYLLITKIIAPYVRNFDEYIQIYTGTQNLKYIFEEFYYSEQGSWLLLVDIHIHPLQICQIQTNVPLHIYAIHTKVLE